MEKRVLLVDADPTFADGVARDLGRSGIAVSVVPDDGAAIDRAKTARHDVIVLSEVAERNVFATCNRVRRTPGLGEVPVVVLSESATASAIEAHRTSRTPAALYLRKPLDGAALAQALRPLLAGAPAAADPGAIEEVGAEDVIDDVEPIDEPPPRVPAPVAGEIPGPPPPLELPPDPFAESGNEPRPALGGSPEERLQFLRDRLRARDELVQKARAAWSARDREQAALHAHATRLFEAIAGQQAAVAERDDTISELERSVLDARREHAALKAAEAELREQLEDAEGRAGSLSEILNDTLKQREEGDRDWSARVAEVEASARELQTELDGLRSAREQLDEALGRAAAELRDAREQLDAAATRETILKEELEELARTSEERERQLEEQLREQRESLERDAIQVRDELENELAAVRGELSAQIAELTGELAATREDAGDRSLEVEQARGVIDDLTARLEDAARRLADAERLADQRASRIAAAGAEAEAARNEVLAARSRIEALEGELEATRAAAMAQEDDARRMLDERVEQARQDLESAIAAERADAEARLAEQHRLHAEERSRREEEIEAALAEAEARIATLEAQAAEEQQQLRSRGEARLDEVRAATRADLEARLAQVGSAAAARVRALEEELERRDARHAEELAAARGDTHAQLAQAGGEAEARIAELLRQHEEVLEAERRQARIREQSLVAELEQRLARARAEADEAIAHARAEIEERLAGSETDADERVAVLERRLREERAEHERELQALRAEADEPGSFITVDTGAADAAEVRAAREQITALEAQVKAAVEQAARFRGDRDRAAAAYEKAREEAVRLRRLQQGGAEVEQLRRELSEVRASRERLQDELASQIADLASMLARRDAELAAAREAAAGTPDLQAALHKVELLEREHERLLAGRERAEEEFQRQLAGLTSEGDAAVIQGLRKRINELQDQLQGGASRERLQQLESELEEARGENEFLSSEVARYAEKVAALAGKGPAAKGAAARPIARIKR